MEKEAVTSLKGADRPRQIQLAVRLLMVLAAAVAVAAFFLPWGTADEEYREAAAQMPDVVYYEPTGMTVSDAADLSLMEYAGVYHSMGSVWEVYAVIMYAILAASVLALLLAAMGKPIGAGVFTILMLAASRVLVWDFEDRGVLPGSTHVWGAAPTAYLVASLVLILAAVGLFVLRRREKAAAKAVATVAQNVQ